MSRVNERDLDTLFRFDWILLFLARPVRSTRLGGERHRLKGMSIWFAQNDASNPGAWDQVSKEIFPKVWSCGPNRKNKILKTIHEWKDLFLKTLWCLVDGEVKDENFHCKKLAKLTFRALAPPFYQLLWYYATFLKTLQSLSDEDCDQNVTNLHISQWPCFYDCRCLA